MKFKDKHDTGVTMGAHDYKNIELVQVDGVIRVKSKKTGELMKHSVSPVRVKAVSLHG